MTRFLTALALSLMALSSPALTEGHRGHKDGHDKAKLIGNDLFAMQEETSPDGALNSLWAVADRISVTHPIARNAHMIGGQIEVSAPVGGSVYAAGESITIAQPVLGDVSVAGSDLMIESSVDGNVRFLGDSLLIAAPVAGNVLTRARHVTINETVSGNLYFGGESLEFIEGAKIEGQLFVRSGKALDVPASVISADRIVQKSNKKLHHRGHKGSSLQHQVVHMLVGWAIWVVLGMVILLLFARTSTIAATRLRDAPLRSAGWGLIAVATAIGTIPTLILTVIGIVLTPIALILIPLFFLAAWTMGLASVSAWVAEALGYDGDEPAVIRISFVLGALVLLALGLLPALGLGFLCWIVWLAAPIITLLGAGLIFWRMLPSKV